MADEFGVSRVTVNRAVGVLRAEGRVRVIRGSGAFVEDRTDRHPWGRHSLSGCEPPADAAYKTGPAPADIAAALNLPADTNLRVTSWTTVEASYERWALEESDGSASRRQETAIARSANDREAAALKLERGATVLEVLHTEFGEGSALVTWRVILPAARWRLEYGWTGE